MNFYRIDFGAGVAQFWAQTADGTQALREFRDCASECFGIRKSLIDPSVLSRSPGTALPEEFGGREATHLLIHGGDEILFDRRHTGPDGHGWKLYSEWGEWCTCEGRGQPDAGCAVHGN